VRRVVRREVKKKTKHKTMKREGKTADTRTEIEGEKDANAS